VNQDDKGRRFQEAVLPHISAAYNLARWLVRDGSDADDIVQDSYLRALRFFDGFRGNDGRAWLLTIVRTRCYSWLRKKAADQMPEFDEQLHSEAADDAALAGGLKSADPEVLLSRLDDASRLNAALAGLPAEFREAIVLRELEDMSYKQIAAVTGVPMGTVMSRIARGRKLLLQRLQCLEEKKS
jgi:RNA polymerase sigma-70 factor (ECF subfamily)